ncbi:hypothetical protein D8674_011921 [Pyrus ussuriensis x Pyrus communis]|uniref:Uncharacterized protein n=1 Tax=Pyrus ussuriensis x Pyrus communis TaxID=2448454 RepID=A0A5N5G071_9ROSA|nr:hypothetical protein D8674_011921 [Pyrus ussuriensis x Pyrus communis]
MFVVVVGRILLQLDFLGGYVVLYQFSGATLCRSLVEVPTFVDFRVVSLHRLQFLPSAIQAHVLSPSAVLYSQWRLPAIWIALDCTPLPSSCPARYQLLQLLSVAVFCVCC